MDCKSPVLLSDGKELIKGWAANFTKIELICFDFRKNKD
jgi:hypothetical protein